MKYRQNTLDDEISLYEGRLEYTKDEGLSRYEQIVLSRRSDVTVYLNWFKQLKLMREYFTLLSGKYGEEKIHNRMLELRKQIYKSMGIEVIE